MLIRIERAAMEAEEAAKAAEVKRKADVSRYREAAELLAARIGHETTADGHSKYSVELVDHNGKAVKYGSHTSTAPFPNATTR